MTTNLKRQLTFWLCVICGAAMVASVGISIAAVWG